jgi:hypothetical protein
MRTPSSGRDEWRRLLDEVLVEDDAEKLKPKIAELETALFERLQALGSDSADQEVRIALKDAATVLLALKETALDFPDRGTKKRLQSVRGKSPKEGLGNPPWMV